MTGTNQKNLPHLLYVSDVIVESSFHGSALLYRLLQNYPVDRLLILQPTGVKGADSRRLKDVKYVNFRFGHHQLLHSRFARFYRTWLALTSKRGARAIRRASAEFKPDAVLTVAHGFSWIAAAEFARQQKLPLYLIVHDDWPHTIGALSIFKRRYKRLFGAVVRQATVTFCVSPGMSESYRDSYAAHTCLLYPSQPRTTIPAKLRSIISDDGLRVAFAGTINSDGYASLLRSVASALKSFQGRLLLFGPHSPAALKLWGLDLETVEDRGLVDSDNIASALLAAADVLLVPMSFADYEKENMTLGFPSKIAEYAATGIPMLILGPEYCSAVRWARENEPVAEVVTDQTMKSLTDALDRLRSTQHREMLGRRALQAGEEFFSHQAIESIFFNSLR